MECERGEQGGNGTSIQWSKFRAFHNLIVRKKFGALAVVHNLFSSIESLHLPPSMFLLLKTIRRVSCASFNCGTGAEHKYSYSMPPPCLLGALFRVSKGTLPEERGGRDLKGPSYVT